MQRPTLLFVARGPVPATAIDWLASRFPDRAVSYLQLDAREIVRDLPAGWTLLTINDLGTLEELRREYLGYLERIADVPIGGQGTLNSLLRRRDGDSLWWTDVALRRSPNRGMYSVLKAIWLVTKAIEKFAATDVAIHTANPRDAAILFGAAHSAENVHFVPGSAIPGLLPMVDLPRWSRETRAFANEFIRHRRERANAVGMSTPTARSVEPTIVLSTLFPRHVATKNGQPQVDYWQLLVERLTDTRIAYLFDLDPPDAWPLNFDFDYLRKHQATLAAIPNALPLWTATIGRWIWSRIASHQRRLIRRYVLLERDRAFRAIFRFRGVDLSQEWIVELRHAVSMAIRWEADVEAATALLRSAGNVRLVLVHQEFEPRGMMQIAACRRLGLKTLGVQHGTFYPLHTIYTPPEVQLRLAPTPDHYAVYGEFTKMVLSEFGAYPAERIHVAAGSRFDALATARPDRDALRDRLQLPRDRCIVLVTTQAYPWFVEAVRAALLGAPDDAWICIKTFPADAARYEALIAETGSSAARIYIDRFDLLLAACDVLVSASSTTVLEATLATKPTICLNFTAEQFYYPYVEEGVSLGVRDADELRSALHALRNFVPDQVWHDRRRSFLRRHLGPAADGRAAEEFAALIRRLSD